MDFQKLQGLIEMGCPRACIQWSHNVLPACSLYLRLATRSITIPAVLTLLLVFRQVKPTILLVSVGVCWSFLWTL